MREQLYACEPNYILGYLDRVENATEEETRLAASMFDGDEDSDPVDDIYEEDGDEARITVEGLLTMAGPSPIARLFGDTGTSYRDIIAACNRAAASAAQRVTFAINSPGGDVAGCDQAWQAIRALNSSKPCTAENNGMMASAAYWLGSACKRIVATSPACEQGSIGVKQVVIDDSGLRDSIGIKKITIVSKNAPKKGEDPAKKADLNSMQQRCDAMESVFISRVAEGRGITAEEVIKNFGQGAVLISEEAQAAGMIDAVVPPRGIPQAVAPAVPDTSSRRMPGMSGLAAQHTPPADPAPLGRKPMTFEEFIASDPTAKARLEQMLAAAEKAGTDKVQTRITAAKPFLALAVTKDGYSAAEASQIGKLAVDVIGGSEDPSALRAFVRMVDMQVESRKQAAAVAETTAGGETPPKKLEDDATLLARAAELKLDVKAIQAEAVARKLDPVEVLKAAIETKEQLARDKDLMGPTGTGA